MKSRMLMLTTCGVCLLGLSALAQADDVLPPTSPAVEETAPVPPTAELPADETPSPVVITDPVAAEPTTAELPAEVVEVPLADETPSPVDITDPVAVEPTTAELPVEVVEVTTTRPDMPQPNERTLDNVDTDTDFIAYSAAPGVVGNVPEIPTSLVPDASIEAASASLDAAVADQAAAASEMPDTFAVPATVEAKVDTNDATPTGGPMIRDGHLIAR